MKNQKGKNENFPKIDIVNASNETLIDEYSRATSGTDHATTSAEMRFYEAYEQELKAEILKRMGPR